MKYRYLYNTNGKFVAFIIGKNIFATDSKWLGTIKRGNEFYDQTGGFVGYVLSDDRVAKKTNEFPRLPKLPTMRPIPPIPPISPIPRLPKLPLPYPYKDVFQED